MKESFGRVARFGAERRTNGLADGCTQIMMPKRRKVMSPAEGLEDDDK